MTSENFLQSMPQRIKIQKRSKLWRITLEKPIET